MHPYNVNVYIFALYIIYLDYIHIYSTSCFYFFSIFTAHKCLCTFLKDLFNFNYIYAYVSLGFFPALEYSAHKGKKEASDLLDLEL